ncbi:tigger transposable element-derived protein 6 [Ceratobasidium sp. AG-Ba]|nr:tigger transposable element-derived protein 6 [Ceratobasidium sp. AG-Ba]
MLGFKDEKSRLSLGLCTNEDGSDKRDPLFIGYYEKPRLFGGQTGAALGFDFEFDPTAWMNDKVWTRWILRFDAEMRQQNCNVLLLCDNAPSHKKFDRTRLTNVQLEFLAPNLTAFIQPLDAGIIRCFEAHYHRGLLKKAIEGNTAGHADPYRINQLEGMLLAKEAWSAVKPSTIINCWRHTGICPPNLPPTADPNDSVMAELLAQLDYAGIPVSAAEWVGFDQYTDTEQPLTDELIAKAVGVQPEIHQAMISITLYIISTHFICMEHSLSVLYIIYICSIVRIHAFALIGHVSASPPVCCCCPNPLDSEESARNSNWKLTINFLIKGSHCKENRPNEDLPRAGFVRLWSARIAGLWLKTGKTLAAMAPDA